MEERQQKYLEEYENRLSERVVGYCHEKNLLPSYMFDVAELKELWKSQAPEYMADAVPQIREYPLAAIAWAAYFGISAAVDWDTSDGNVDKMLYISLRSHRGFDYLDEEAIAMFRRKYPNRTEEIDALEDVLRSVAQICNDMIRKEGIEPQSVMAFHVFARTERVMFNLGVSLALNIMGYHYKKARVELPS